MNPDDASENAMLPLLGPLKIRQCEGKNDESYDFCRCMSDAAECSRVGREEESRKHRLQVFWYSRPSPTCGQAASNSVQERLKCFLLSLEGLQWMKTGGCLIQFWAPVGERKMLSLSGQPFGVGQITDQLCRYRYYCIQYQHKRKSTSEADPIDRSFARGSPEFTPNIDSYSNEEFPLRDHARKCGFQGYLALPLFEQDQRLCVGVLEILTFTTDISLDLTFGEKIEDVGFAIRWPAPDRLAEVGWGKYGIKGAVLSPLRDRYNLPLVQVWFPCIAEGARVSFSDDHTSHWFCGLQLLDWNLESLPFHIWSGGQPYLVENGGSWIGRAHSENKVCFIENVSQFSIFHYPLVPLTRLSNLTSCVAIPLRLLHPDLPPLVLEAFLPQPNCVDDRELLLKSLISTLAELFLRNSAEFGLAPDERFSYMDSFVYYDVHQTKNAGWLSLGLGKQDQEVITVQEDHFQHFEGDDLTATNAELFFKVVQMTQPGETSKATKTLGGDLVKTHQALVQQKDRVMAETSRVRITSDVVQQYFGKNLKDAAGELGVSRSTLKRKCRSFGIKRWPPKFWYQKRNKIDLIPKSTNAFTDSGSHGDQGSSNKRKKVFRVQPNRKSLAENRSVYDHKYGEGMIVKARYKEDIVKFPVRRNLGIQALRSKLSRRFQLEVDWFRIKYQEDGDWIMISCTQDLNYYMHLLESLGRTTMHLSLLSATQ